MLTENTLNHLRSFLDLLFQQTNAFIDITNNQTYMGQLVRGRQDALERIKVYVQAAQPGDDLDDFKDSIATLRDDALAQIDGSEQAGDVGFYSATNEFWDQVMG